MSDIHARTPILLFMKAVTKKQVWVPGYTKRDGTVVQGHMHWVNVSTDHDEHKAVAGQGNYTEKEAHKKLSKKGWFNAMPHDHKVAHVLKEATAIQQKASMLSRANTLKKKILAGENPINAEWKAFDSLPGEKQEEFGTAFKEAGKWNDFAEGYQKWKASVPAEAPQAATEPEHKPALAKEPEKAPEPAPVAKEDPKPEHVEAAKEQAAQNDKAAAVLDKIEAAKAKLPADHHITPGQKKKLDAIAHALITGDEKSILNHGYPTHTYGAQAAKLANEALEAMGSKHKVEKGQKMGAHAALNDKPAAEHNPEPAAEPAKVVAAQEGPKEGDTKEGADGTLVLKDGHWVKQGGDQAAAATSVALAMPEFAEGKTKTGVKAYYEKVANKIITLANAGHVSTLLAMNNPEKGNTWKGTTANSKKLLALYHDALQQVNTNGGAPKATKEEVDAAEALLNTPVATDAEPAAPTDLSTGYQQAAKTVKGWADKGNLTELAKMATLVDTHSDDMKKLKEYAAALYEWKTGEKAKGETPMPASKGLDAGLAQDADKALEEGDLQTLKDIHAYSEKNGMGPTADYAAKHIATLESKKAAVEQPDTADMSDLAKDAVAAIHSLLTNGSAVGHVGGQVSNLQSYFAAFDYSGNTLDEKKVAAYAKAALESLGETAKHSGAAPTVTDSKPVKPTVSSLTSQAIADTIEKLIDKGDMKGLQDQQTMLGFNQPEGTNFGKLAKYAKEAIEHLTAKNAASWATPNTAAAPIQSVGELLADHPPGMHPQTHAAVKKLVESGDKHAMSQYASGLETMGDPNAEWAKQVADAMNSESGPKEGDTKQGEHGMLVLKDGHWVRMSEEPAAPKKPSVPPEILAGSVPKPKFEGKNKVKMNKTVKELHAIAVSHGAEGLKQVVKLNADGTTKVGGAGISGWWTALKSPNGKLLAAYANSLVEKMEGSSGTGVAPAAAAPKAQKVTGAVAPTTTESVDGWKQVGPQGGYNPGGTYEDASGQKWYVKFPAGGEKVAKNELVATKLYALAGVEVPEVKLINQGGKIGLASKIIDGAVANKSALLEGKAPGLLSGFGADAWLANWDTVGNNPAAGKGFDNILFKPDGSAVRIDAGGALLYGGAGGKKQTFENEVHDLKTLLDPSKNANTAAVFGKMSAADITASVAKIANIPDHEIEGVVMEFGPGSASEKTRLAEKLIARKHNMSEQYPTAKAKKEAGAKVEKKKLDPSALPVDAALLPTPHDFMNWQGTGKPISEKAYVKGNIADEQEILDIALQGNLTALKEFKFQPVDKMTGAPIGEKKSIDEHPSKYVQDFHNNVVSYLDMLANPPEALRPMTAKSASTLASLSAAFKPADFGMTTAKAPKNQQIGFWIALGVAESPEKFAPPAKELSAGAIEKAKSAHPKLPQKVRSFISGVQGSGSYNNPYRDGLDKDHGGNNTREVLTDLYHNATAHEAGTTISKWISFAPEMVKQFMDAPDGLVFQNPGSMCTSYDPTATKHFGKDRITIRYANGAKALDSFASGSFKSEMEVTTLPGARFMVLSRKMVADTEHGKAKEQRFELELLMLPPDPTYVDNLMKKA